MLRRSLLLLAALPLAGAAAFWGLALAAPDGLPRPGGVLYVLLLLAALFLLLDDSASNCPDDRIYC